MPDFSKFLKGFKKKQSRETNITNIGIRYMGDVHGLEGMRVKEKIFELKIPFQNKTGSDLLADSIKRPALKVEAITVSAPFELMDISPKLPISIGYRNKVEIRLKIKTPELPYSGPMTVSLGEKEINMIRVQIEKIVGKTKSRREDLEEEPSVLSVQKGQVLKRDVQLYKILRYGDSVNEIRVNGPFVFSGSDPKLPFKLDKENSYIISVYVLAPQFSYAGPLEISFF